MVWGIVFLGADQLIKAWFLRYLPGQVLINPAIALGMGAKEWIVGIVLLGIGLVGWLYFVSKNPRERLLLAIVLAGSISNLLDRLIRGGVIDYLKLSPLPSFNLADIGVVLAIILLVFHYLFLRSSVIDE